jgi:hypothetical protein
VIASYGPSTIRPRIENNNFFIDHNGQARNYLAIMGIEFFGYTGDPLDPLYNG